MVQAEDSTQNNNFQDYRWTCHKLQRLGLVSCHEFSPETTHIADVVGIQRLQDDYYNNISDIFFRFHIKELLLMNHLADIRMGGE